METSGQAVETADPTAPVPPDSVFKFYVTCGFVGAVLLLILPLLTQGRRSFVFLNLDWLLPAAGVLATIAVATVLMDLSELIPDSKNLDKVDPSKSLTGARSFAEKQLNLGVLLLAGIGLGSATCAWLAGLHYLTRAPVLNGQPPSASGLPEILVVILAHLAVTGICSLGLGYKNEKFLKNINVSRTEKLYEPCNWSEKWGIDISTIQLLPAKRLHRNHSLAVRSVPHIYYALVFAVALGAFVPSALSSNTLAWLLLALLYVAIQIIATFGTSELFIDREILARNSSPTYQNRPGLQRLLKVVAIVLYAALGFYQVMILVSIMLTYSRPQYSWWFLLVLCCLGLLHVWLLFYRYPRLLRDHLAEQKDPKKFSNELTHYFGARLSRAALRDFQRAKKVLVPWRERRQKFY